MNGPIDPRSSGSASGELARLRRVLEAREAQVAKLDRRVRELSRALRHLEDLRCLLGYRTMQLVDREREVSELKLEMARRNQRMSRLERNR